MCGYSFVPVTKEGGDAYLNRMLIAKRPCHEVPMGCKATEGAVLCFSETEEYGKTFIKHSFRPTCQLDLQRCSVEHYTHTNIAPEDYPWPAESATLGTFVHAAIRGPNVSNDKGKAGYNNEKSSSTVCERGSKSSFHSMEKAERKKTAPPPERGGGDHEDNQDSTSVNLGRSLDCQKIGEFGRRCYSPLNHNPVIELFANKAKHGQTLPNKHPDECLCMKASSRSTWSFFLNLPQHSACGLDDDQVGNGLSSSVISSLSGTLSGAKASRVLLRTKSYWESLPATGVG
jgi:hypothetical protein